MGWCILTWAIGIFTGFWFGRGCTALDRMGGSLDTLAATSQVH